MSAGRARVLIVNRDLVLRNIRCFAVSSQADGRLRDSRSQRFERRRYSHSSSQSQQASTSETSRNSSLKWTALAFGLSAAAGATLYWKMKQSPVVAAKVEAGTLKKGLPIYSKADVAKHKTKEGRIWVTFKNGVYDITEFQNQHPGGNKILLAAGGSLEPFWQMYAVHKTPEVLEMLEGLRIGNITEVDPPEKLDANDPYRNEPARNPILIPASLKPFNAEPPTQLLADEFITPTDLHFIRNHLPVPDVNPRDYCLQFGLEDCMKSSMNLNDLRTKLPKKTQVVTIQCAGNRRNEMTKVKSVRGLGWNHAAIANAEWSGPTLHDVLKYAGIDIYDPKYKHIIFEGTDLDPEGAPYGASIPIEKARALQHDIIIAYEMNGADIPRDHGYPVRAVLPGIVAARQVKWLKTIRLSEEESYSHWQRKDYKGFNTSVDWDSVCFEKSTSLCDLPVTSAICDPPSGSELEPGACDVTIKGYAWSGGGRGIIRVDVSADGGKTWQDAELAPSTQGLLHVWAWRLWEATLPLPCDHNGEVEVVCKAVDDSYNVQPENAASVWNLRGILSTAWHRIKLTVPPEK